VFCPNCGAQNQDTANACTKCGFALKAPGAAPKFKGTMLMMNAPPAQAKPSAPTPGQAPPPGAPPQAAPPQQAAPPAAAPAAAAPKPRLKGTMIGVAPPSLGSNVPAGGSPVVDPVPPPPPHDFGGAGGYGQPPPQQPGYGSTQQGYAAPGAGYPPPGGYGAPQGAPPTAPSSAVNPLGGTVVADASAFTNPAFANAPPQQPPGGFDPNAQPQGYGTPYNPPPAQGGYGGFDPGAPPPQFGGPQGGGYGAPQPGYGNPGFNSTEPAGASYGAMSPYGSSPPLEPVRNSNIEIPGTVGGQNPIVTVLLIVCTCGIYGIYLLVKGKKAQGE